MYATECDVAWGSRANMYLENKYVYIYICFITATKQVSVQQYMYDFKFQ